MSQSTTSRSAAPGRTRATILTGLTATSTVLALTATGLAVWVCTRTPDLPSAIRADEVTAEKISIVEPDGQPRLIMANDRRSPGGTVDGKTLRPDGGRPGMIFFDGRGNEIGGLTTDAYAKDGHRIGAGQLSFDQYRQDQTVVLRYEEVDGKRSAGLSVQDRPDTPLITMLPEYQRIEAMPEGPQKAAALEQFQAKYPAPKRVFVGKDSDNQSTLVLSDVKGKPRLTLTVGKDGAPAIQFLDAEGRVTKTLK